LYRAGHDIKLASKRHSVHDIMNLWTYVSSAPHGPMLSVWTCRP